jgi:hypothetical protein
MEVELGHSRRRGTGTGALLRGRGDDLKARIVDFR